MKYLLILLSILILNACSQPQAPKIQKAIAVINATETNTVSGTVTFEQKTDHVLVTATLSGLSKNQKHGFHVHEYGDISSPDGKSAGGHYNPEGHAHGLPPQEQRHAGSYGNIQADENGNATFIIKDTTTSISGTKNPILGRAVVIHAKEDTGVQPTGGAGARIGLGVIGIAK